MKIAFYKAKYGNIYDKIIAFWTGSIYSHCELIIEDLWYSSSPREGGVRRTNIIPSEHWDIFKLVLPRTDYFYKKRCVNLLGKNYDWVGIFFSQFIPLNLEESKSYWCSEFIADVLMLEDKNISPIELFQYLKLKGMLR